MLLKLVELKKSFYLKDGKVSRTVLDGLSAPTHCFARPMEMAGLTTLPAHIHLQRWRKLYLSVITTDGRLDMVVVFFAQLTVA